MVTANTIIKNPYGLHLRVAGKIVETAKRFDVHVQISKGRKIADGRSVWQMLMLDAGHGCPLKIAVDGTRERHAIREIENVFNSREMA